MLDFVRDADVLILDSQYDRAEYKMHTGWATAAWMIPWRSRSPAGVKHLYLFHHDPDHDDGAWTNW